MTYHHSLQIDVHTYSLLPPARAVKMKVIWISRPATETADGNYNEQNT